MLKKHIFANSNFNNASQQEQYLIYKFLQRTWMYEQAMINDLRALGLKSIQVNGNTTIEELKNRCLRQLEDWQ